MAPSGGQTTVGLTVAANMDVSGILNGVKSMQGAFNGLKLPANLTGDAIKQFDKLKESLTKYRELMEKGPSTKADLKQLEKLEKTIKSSFSDLSKIYDEFSNKKIYLEADATAIKNAQKDIDQLKQDVQNKLGSIKFEFSSPTKGKVDIGLNDLVSDMERAVKSSKTVSASMKEMTNSVKSGNFTDAAKGLVQIEQQASKLKGASIGLLKTFQQMGLIQFNKSAEDLYKSGQHVALLHQGFEKLRGVLSADDAELKQVIKSLEDAVTKKGELEKIGETNYRNSLSAEKQNIDGLAQGYNQCADAARGFTQQTLSAAQQVEQLQQSTQYFFSLRNMINLLKRGIDEAVQSVKDLDKAMTETAVVTDYKVSDLWGMLPEYTKVANQLGATTQGAYETMTLYYQQGLEQQQAFELGAETMKMARIAGLDYAETTDMMTAALRGFNMELNETSAKRVNDVYSELAAITASDTEELGTAMQRTASIAASAGASFEGTTAFLAQAIETTREPAENIGTAMKTIVARFQELKKNPLEISEVDGEEVDYNKIDTALKTIGVDLKDANGQFRDFDQVMLDISARWDSLSQAQQRYIATTAAGSRQQSRFIAMVSNYDRTMQLMEAANNSAGASDEQFGKTMDSLESKLNKLHNAWQQFTMGIANNGMIKLAVDGLTGFLNVTNKIIDTLSLGSGVFKSFLSIFAAFTGLKVAGRAANSLIGGLGGLVDPQSTVKEGLKIGLFGQGKTNAQAKAITTPIVGSLSKISGQIAAIAKRQGIKDAGQKGSTAGVKESSKEDYVNTKRLFSQLSGKEGFKMGDTSKLFGNLDAKHQLSMFNNNPGTKQAMKRASMNWFSGLGLSPELEKEGKTYVNSIYKGMKEGQIPVDKGIELIGQPQKWGQYFGTETAQAYSKSFIKESIPAMEESTQIAHEAAMYSLGLDPNDYKVGSDEIKQLFKDKNNKQLKEDYAALYGDFRKDIEKSTGHEGAKGKVSDLGRLAKDIGSVGDKFTQAGYGINAFGNALSQLGGPLGAIGTGIAAFGSAISSMGMMVSGATSLITVFSEGIEIAGTSIAISGGAIAAVAAPLAAAAAAFLLVRAHLKKVKEVGEEVTNTFNETNKTAEDNIAKLKSYQSEFATLSKGVDANGNNVSLDDSQYQRYLEIVDDIAAINPDIVEGYNAQGHAIINNNKALAETLKTQQEIRDEARNTYISEDSLQKLINARNINNDFKAINVKGESPSVYDGSGHGSEGRQKPVGLGRDVFNIVDQLRLNKDFDESSLQKYGIDSLDSLINGEEQAVKNFIKHRQQIQADLTNSGLKLNESIIKGFDKLGEDAAAFDEAIKPVYDNLLANVSNSKVFESIAPEFRNALNIGLKDLASQDLDAPEMAKAANNMAMRFANLTNGSGKYKDALDIVEKAQDSFASSLDETQYYADVQPAIDDLIRLKEEALNEGSAYGDALAEYLENQIQRISNFTTEGGANLTETLNTATDEIAAAEGALDSFNEATKKDFSTAAEGMKGIFDKATETFKDSYGTEIQKHAEGMGDATFWTGAEALLSEKEIERLTKGKNGYDAAEAVAKKIKGLEPMLREGQEGFDAFTDRVLENADAMDKLAEAGVKYDKESGLITNIPDDQWHNVAEALGISDDLLTSMLNKGRQFADISFMNVEDARKALAASDYTIQGNSSTAGNKNLYVKEDTLRMELSDAGYVRREQQDEQIKKLLAQGVKTIPASDSKELTQDKLKDMADDWGVKTLPDLIQTLNDTGDFTKDEIQEYAEKLDLIGDLDFDTVYSDLISALDNPELAKQTQELAELHGTTTAILDQMSGNTPEKQMQDAESLRKDTFGGDGVDTAVEAFGQGKKLGKDGTLEFMTPEEFATQSKYVSDLVNDYNKAAKQAQINADATTGATSKSYQQVADYYTKLAADTQREYERGLANYESNLQRQENAAKKTADREESIRQAKIKKIPKNVKANEDNKTKTPGQTKTETVETITKKTNTEKNETTKKTTIVDGKTTPGFNKTEQATKSLEDKDGMIVNVATKAELAGANAVIKSLGGINDKTVTVKTEGDTSGAIAVKNAIANVTGKIVTIGTKLGNTSAIKTIDDKIAALARKGNNIKIGTTVAIGQNNYIPHQSIPSFGSAARGRGGTVGPRNKGGLTLTGEKGFEIAWLPKENRSMILGADGPQMLNLPSDAVVYTHEQSKKILKQKGIPAGSHADEEASGSSYKKKYPKDDKKVVIKTEKKKKEDKHKKDTDKQNKKNADNAAKVIKKAGNVNAWWWNMGKKVEATQRLIDKTFKKIEKLTNTVGTSLADVSKEGDFYIKKLNKQISLNTTMMDKAQKQLSILDKGAGSKKKKSVKAAQNRVDRAEAKVKKAQKNHDKKTEKRAKKELKKAKKNLRKKQNTANYSTISYDVTVQKKDKKGKVTKTKKNKKQRMDLSPYVKLDKATGAYVVDYKKINSKNWDKSKKKAVMEAAEKKAETYQKRKDTAEDNIEKAQEALDELGKNLYETFLSWEIELTRIWNISQKIAESEARRERAESFSELLEVQLGNGVKRILNADGSINQEYLDKITNTFEKGVQEQVNTITLTQESIGIKANELYKSLSTTGEQTTLGNVQKLVENAKFTNDFLADAEKELDKASTAAQQVANAKEDKAEAKEDKKEAKDEKKKAGKTKTKKDDKKAQEKINEAKAAIEAADKIITEQSKIAAEAQTAAEDYQKQAEFYIQQNNGKTYTDTEILAYEREIKELEDQIKIKNAALEFTKVTPNTDGTVTIDFHTEEFEKARQEGRFTAADAEKIQAYVQKLVDDSKDIQETYKTLTEQLTTLNTTLTELQEAWVGYADDLLSYLEEEQSKEITKLKTLSDSIKDSLSKLLDQVKKTLQERRNQEDNAKTEQDILRKQQRLAALRANTSGGNQVEIAQLEREINEAQTSYGRTLEDQLLDRLSNQADEAAEQREKQIKIQEGIRDTVNNAATVNKWMSSPAMFQDAIKQAFFSAQDWENMPLAKQEAIEKSFQTFYAGLLTNQKKQTTIADAIQTTSSMVEFIEDSLGGNVGKDITDDTANTDSLDATVREIAADINSNINRSQNVITEQVANTAAEANVHADEQFNKQQAIDDYRNQKVIAINDKAISATELKSLITKGTAAEMTESDIVSDLAGTDELTWKEIIQAAKDAQFSSSQVLGWFQDSWSANRKNYFNNAYNTIYKPKTKRKTNYKTGGLADFTGPAWLDGTPSKPELVLNAKDTQNFIALKNILSKAIGSTNSVMTSYGGNTTYEININVDHLNNDYDIDRVAERVKKIIVKDSNYRNVTQVRNFR